MATGPQDKYTVSLQGESGRETSFDFDRKDPLKWLQDLERMLETIPSLSGTDRETIINSVEQECEAVVIGNRQVIEVLGLLESSSAEPKNEELATKVDKSKPKRKREIQLSEEGQKIFDAIANDKRLELPPKTEYVRQITSFWQEIIGLKPSSIIGQEEINRIKIELCKRRLDSLFAWARDQLSPETVSRLSTSERSIMTSEIQFIQEEELFVSDTYINSHIGSIRVLVQLEEGDVINVDTSKNPETVAEVDPRKTWLQKTQAYLAQPLEFLPLDYIASVNEGLAMAEADFAGNADQKKVIGQIRTRLAEIYNRSLASETGPKQTVTYKKPTGRGVLVMIVPGRDKPFKFSLRNGEHLARQIDYMMREIGGEMDEVKRRQFVSEVRLHCAKVIDKNKALDNILTKIDEGAYKAQKVSETSETKPVERITYKTTFRFLTLEPKEWNETLLFNKRNAKDLANQIDYMIRRMAAESENLMKDGRERKRFAAQIRLHCKDAVDKNETLTKTLDQIEEGTYALKKAPEAEPAKRIHYEVIEGTRIIDRLSYGDSLLMYVEKRRPIALHLIKGKLLAKDIDYAMEAVGRTMSSEERKNFVEQVRLHCTGAVTRNADIDDVLQEIESGTYFEKRKQVQKEKQKTEQQLKVLGQIRVQLLNLVAELNGEKIIIPQRGAEISREITEIESRFPEGHPHRNVVIPLLRHVSDILAKKHPVATETPPTARKIDGSEVEATKERITYQKTDDFLLIEIEDRDEPIKLSRTNAEDLNRTLAVVFEELVPTMNSAEQIKLKYEIQRHCRKALFGSSPHNFSARHKLGVITPERTVKGTKDSLQKAIERFEGHKAISDTQKAIHHYELLALKWWFQGNSEILSLIEQTEAAMQKRKEWEAEIKAHLKDILTKVKDLKRSTEAEIERSEAMKMDTIKVLQNLKAVFKETREIRTLIEEIEAVVGTEKDIQKRMMASNMAKAESRKVEERSEMLREGEDREAAIDILGILKVFSSDENKKLVKKLRRVAKAEEENIFDEDIRELNFTQRYLNNIMNNILKDKRIEGETLTKKSASLSKLEPTTLKTKAEEIIENLSSEHPELARMVRKMNKKLRQHKKAEQERMHKPDNVIPIRREAVVPFEIGSDSIDEAA